MRIAKLSDFKRKDPLWVIILSVVLCSVLMVYPLSYELSGWRPMFMLLIVLFWSICQPSWCGVWFAFSIGIFTDLLLDAPLGLNALSFVLITFFIRYLIRERRIITFTNLWTISTLAVFAHLTFMWLTQTMGGIHFSLARHWQPMITSILAWPVLYYFLHKWRI